tara:strand:+ start:30 stop:266 length:237 start_codon:yes stop_codon:yes gene_type:complete
MKNALDSNIMQTKTVETIVDLLKKVKTITKTSTDDAESINQEIDFIINFHNKSVRKIKRRKELGIQNRGFSGIYKVNM